jgi:cytochrome P450
MTAATEHLTDKQPATAAESGGSGGGLAAASLSESLTVLVTGVVPALVRGLFSPRPRAMKLLSAVDADARTISVLSGLRSKYGGEGIRLLGGRLAVLWGAGAIRDVLDHSAELYASDAGAKAKGMCHFQPEALTLSRGEEWRDRRSFNESVLASHDAVHPLGAKFMQVVADEVERLDLGSQLQYGDWERLFDRITLRVIFGDRARDEQDLTELLEKLMGQSNRLVGLSKSDDYYEFYGRIERHLGNPDPDSLLGRFAQAPHSDLTRVTHQIPHWMFAMRDTLGANAFRTLAAVVADPEVERRVREEIGAADLANAEAISGLSYLEGCLQEAMRLWPTTPLLARETTRDTTLAGAPLEEGTQVLMLNVFNHRDPDSVESADQLCPERWQNGSGDYRFNHLSNGTQDCPGGPLVSLIGKAALARMLDAYTLRLVRPWLLPGNPLPASLDFFETVFSAQRRERS